MKRFLLPIFALALLSMPLSTVQADTTYAINLSGVAPETSHVLRVFGTITIDFTKTITSDQFTSSSLQFQHESDTPVALPAVPEFSPAANANLAWSDTAGTLNIVRTGSADSFIRWKVPTGNLDAVFVLGSGTRTHNLNRQDNGTPIEAAVLNPNEGNQGAPVFPLGVSVPEPSSAVVLMGISAALITRRRKRA